jgi:hypothetical protein
MICDEGTIYLDKITKKLLKGDSLLISLPLRLGIDKITPEYFESLLAVFSFP